MRIVGFGGSNGAASATTLLLHRCLEHAADLGADTSAFTAEQLGALPIYASDEPAGEQAEQFVTGVRSADCVVVATPGYHGGMSGLVKNALDHLEALRNNDRPYLDGKAAGVIVGA